MRHTKCVYSLIKKIQNNEGRRTALQKNFEEVKESEYLIVRISIICQEEKEIKNNT